jgi:hypothetical protein
LFREGGRWQQHGSLGDGQHQPVQLRLFLRRLHAASAVPYEELRWSTAEGLPVRDLFAADNVVFGKSYAEEQDTRPLGVLVDSRPNPEAKASALPRFLVLLERAGRVTIEYSHPDLLGGPYRDPASGKLHLPWRGPTDEPIDLELDPTQDSLEQLRSTDGPYYLYFLALDPSARSLPEALGLHRPDDVRRRG